MKANDKKNPKPSRVPVERSQWSESSQRTYALLEFYEDRTWSCRGCGQSFVFTAQEQKRAYEDEGVYIYWHPTLCAACAEQAQATADAIQRHEARWQANRQEMQDDRAFLKRWLDSLETYARLSGRRNQSVIAMLQQLLRAKH